ncbi:hypothetical protein ILUMI_01339 [Ignelater luminosus]|uniref:OTU domain-containing protein n=1 Tax=Ignelater luminosus TaxID=2038154 RepID=A0A8K0DKG8_IGNLU|nr:hypothetical protein ILUMI_01339 [Ignelater luminosus]
MSKFSKRGRNPGAADFWLESLGYYRKNVAYDETCLFRAVSEQLFATQINHEEIRKRCITYGKQHSRQFAHLVPKKKDWYERLKKLGVHMVVCNELEIQLICCTYSVDITLFIAATNDKKEFYPLTRYKGEQRLLLCQMGEDHYDAVYPKEHIASAGFCQSVVYNMLYEKVFEIPDAEAIAHSMLHDKQTNYVTYSPEVVTPKNESKDNKMDCDNSNLVDHAQQSSMLAPFPFKIAKALDPNMYRNIEYDTWIEQRREMRLGNWYYGDNNLILGTRCLLTVGDEELECYIQTMFEDDSSKCEVYITKLAERLTVNYTELKPEMNAKPWPLPYRFSRSQSATTSETPSDNDRKSLRKRREKKRSQYNNEQNGKLETKDAATEVNVSNYEGYPLLMQNSQKAPSPEQQLSVVVNKEASEPAKERSGTPLSEAVSWAHSSESRQEPYQNATTECITYEENTNEVYNYAFTEQENTYPVMPVWPSPDQYVMTPDSAISDDVMVMSGKPEAPPNCFQ